MKYFIIVNNQQQGPFTIDELKQQGITAETSVWCEGMPQWAPASQVDELKDVLQESANGDTTPTPPPFESTAQQQPQQPQPATNSQADTIREVLKVQENERQRIAEEQKKHRRRNYYIACAVAVVLLFILALTNPGMAEHRQSILDRVDTTSQQLNNIDNPAVRSLTKAMARMGGGATKDILKEMIDDYLEYHNYVFFSTTTLHSSLLDKDTRCSTGYLGHVSAADISDITTQIILEEMAKANNGNLNIDPSELADSDKTKSPEEQIATLITKAIKKDGTNVDSLTKKVSGQIANEVSKQVKKEISENTDSTTAKDANSILDQIIQFLKNL